MSELTEEEFQELKDAFELYEKNSADGKVDAQELSKLLRSLGQNPSEDDLAKMIQELHIDGQGTLEFPDFLKMMAKRMKDKESDQELRDAFRVFDEEGTGFVSASDLTYILVNLMGEKEEEVKGMMKEVKVTKDGQINYEDFIEIVLK
jgi:calmodulin